MASYATLVKRVNLVPGTIVPLDSFGNTINAYRNNATPILATQEFNVKCKKALQSVGLVHQE